MSSRIWIPDLDPGSGLNFLPIPDPGLRSQKGTGSRIRISNAGKYLDEKRKEEDKREEVNELLKKNPGLF